MRDDKEPKEKAKSLIKYIRQVFNSKDDLIYEFDILQNDDFAIDKPFAERALNAISSGGAEYSVSVIVRGYNVSSAEEMLDIHEAVELGRRGVDIDTYSGTRKNDYAPSIEIRARYDY